MPSDSVTSALVAYTVDVDPLAVSQGARTEVGRRLIDALACAIAGLDAGPVLALGRLAADRPVPRGCAIWGTPHRSAPEVAALANATAIRYLDYSDYTVGGHPSDNIAAIVAACEWSDRTVADLIAGVLVSYEVFGELGRLLVRHRGWDQGTTGGIAAACGVAKALGLAGDEVASAIGIVATGNISTVKTRRGQLTDWKGVAGPYAASAGLLATQMASHGVTAPHDAFQGEFGFWEQVSGPFEIEALAPDRPNHILRAAYKHWPVQFDLQPAVWLGLQLAREVSLDDVVTLDVEASDWTWKGTASNPAHWAPATRETADHSLPFVLTMAAHRGSVSSGDFDEFAARLVECRTTMDRTRVRPAEDITAAALEFCWMRATATLADGSTHGVEVKEPRSNGLSDAELHEKWGRLVRGSRLGDASEGLLSDLLELRADQPVRELVERLRTPTGP